MKQATFSSARSIGSVALLVAAILGIVTPPSMRAETGARCLGHDQICSMEITTSCLFWIFFCRDDVTYTYYSSHHTH